MLIEMVEVLLGYCAPFQVAAFVVDRILGLGLDHDLAREDPPDHDLYTDAACLSVVESLRLDCWLSTRYHC